MRLYDYPASANCYKVRLLVAQLGLAVERVPIDIFGGDTLSDEYAAVNPARETPVLEVSPGQYLPESAAILLYLAEGTSLLPDDRFERAQVVRWLVYEQAEVVPATGGLRFRLQTGRLEPGSPEAERRRSAGERTLGLVESHLQAADFFAAGRYTVADIALYAYLHVAGEAGYDLDRYPALQAWLGRVAGQPGYMNDLEPYPANARLGASRSIYG